MYRAKTHVFIGENPFFGKIGSEGNISDARILHQAVLIQGAEFDYLYDFGDHWRHKITVLKIEGPDVSAKRLECLDGKGACPPEDCGGTSGYKMVKEVLKTPSHPDYARLRQWLGDQPFDPNAFSCKTVNGLLSRLR